MLNKNLICFGAEGETAADIFRIANDMFLQNGYVKETYLEAVTTREMSYPTGLPGDPFNIAIPHTDPEHILQAGIAIIIPKRPIPFRMMGSFEEDDEKLACELIMPLAILDPAAQISTLRKIMGIIQNKELLVAIRNAKDADTVVQLLCALDEA